MTEKNKELSSKILTKINTVKPRPGSYFLLLDLLRFLIIVVLFVIVTVLVSFFIWDLLALLEVVDFEFGSIFSLFYNSLVEILVLSLVLTLPIYFLYRQTDWPLVKNYKYLFAGILILIFLAGIGVYGIAQTNEPTQKIYQNFQDRSEVLPFRDKRRERIIDQAREKGLRPGKVVGIKNDAPGRVEVIIRNQRREETFLVPEPLVSGIKDGDRVVIVLDREGKVREVRKLAPNEKPLFR